MLSRIKPFLSKLGAYTTPRNRGGGTDKQKSYLSHSFCLSEAIYCDSKRISPRSRASLRPLDELPAPYVSFECDVNAWLGWVMLSYQRNSVGWGMSSILTYPQKGPEPVYLFRWLDMSAQLPQKFEHIVSPFGHFARATIAANVP